MGVLTAEHRRIAMGAPDLYTFLDYRAFLRAWFEARKAANPRYSHRLFARRAGQKSPSMLLLVMDGKRNLAPRTVAAFSDAMGLDDDERAFFTELVRLDQADTPGARANALSEILKTTRFREARRLDSDALAFFTHWYFPAIAELAHRPDFVGDAAWIARTLCPAITEDQAAEALQALLDLGLLAPDAHGVPRPTDAQVVTPHEVLDDAVNHYHAGMLARARDAIGTFRSEERHILGITTAIPERLVPELKARLNDVQKELLSACEQEPKERVYQVSIALFPLSRPPEEDP